ncbi:DoxX family protein [Spirosoma sp. KNUC1025]|uniref:DoxX family protein n=1 Tax=Spirosoma sp. KNUC1025 TaxID=2894082 RepID=UPI00386DF435|nr:DoxX family protein [Spirosoma sp. KNUC1025]
MKRDKIVYWAATSLVVLSLGFAGFAYFTDPAVAAGFKHLGFPAYFRAELGIAKIIAALVLIIPAVPAQIKEWAYAGVGITFISAAIAHISSGDPLGMVISPLVFFGILVVSYRYAHKVHALHGQLA